MSTDARVSNSASHSFPVVIKPKVLSYSEEWFIALLCIVTLTFALFWNLDIHHVFVHTDEGRRALVSLEMLLSNNWLTPTLNGEYYYNKPPLYNWIIAGSFALWGRIDEWALRFPAVISVIGFSLTIYYFTKKHLGQNVALVLALSFVTSGRVLFYDSFLGLIDICYAWMIFISIMCLFEGYAKDAKKLAYAGLYIFSALAFLMKGLPALVFAGFTVLAFAITEKHWRDLYSGAHVFGIALFLTIVGGYYGLVEIVHPNSMAETVAALWGESAKRTGLRLGFMDVATHVLTFPFEMAVHFLPWSLLGLLLLSQKNIYAIWRHPLLRFFAVVFAANIVVYWSSPQVYPRYLFPFVPLFHALIIYLYFKTSNLVITKKVINVILFGLIVLLCVVAVYIPFDKAVSDEPFFNLKALFLMVSFGAIAFSAKKRTALILIHVVLALGIARIGVDWFNLEHRNENGYVLKNSAIEISRLTKGQPLYLYKESEVHDGTSFYIERERGNILRHTMDAGDSTAYLITRQQYLSELSDRSLVFNFVSRNGERLSLVH